MENIFKSFMGNQKKKMPATEETVPESSGDLQAKIIVSRLSYNNSVMMIDENGEMYSPPKPDPVVEEMIVKQGDKVDSFKIVDILTNFIKVESPLEYTSCNDPIPKTEFIIEKGECLELNMYGVYDAVHRVSIEYLGQADLTEVCRNTDRNDESVVTKEDWEIEPMPKKTARFTIERKFTDEEIKRLKKGHIPGEMEDKWFFYYEEGKAFFHRSWTGTCIFVVEFNFETNKHSVTVNRDENQYSNTDMIEDIELINYLLGM